jgi:hypothetical protein
MTVVPATVVPATVVPAIVGRRVGRLLRLPVASVAPMTRWADAARLRRHRATDTDLALRKTIQKCSSCWNKIAISNKTRTILPVACGRRLPRSGKS